jgi:pyridoxal phosphate enzyme (YggS family)
VNPCGEVAGRLAAVRERIAGAARRAGRDPSEIALVGVAKRQPAERVVAAVEAGLAHVAENFAQEARDKVPAVNAALAARGLAPPTWHFVGQLQRNKARLVAPLFDCVQSLDRASLAVELDRRASGEGRRVDVLLQVNLSGEAKKGGVAPEALPALLDEIAPLAALRVTGLMTVPAADPDPRASRSTFAQLRALRDDLCKGDWCSPDLTNADLPKPDLLNRRGDHTLRELSMGMSADFEVAVEEGATLVRVGTAIFGPRPA